MLRLDVDGLPTTSGSPTKNITDDGGYQPNLDVWTTIRKLQKKQEKLKHDLEHQKEELKQELEHKYEKLEQQFTEMKHYVKGSKCF